MIVLLAACLLPPATVRPDVDAVHGFALEAHGHAMAGMAAVAVAEGDWRLDALLPTGTALFSVRVTADGTTVDAADPALGAWVGRIPFDRDLAALYRYACVDRCRAGRWTLRVRDGATRIRGPGGPATLTEADGVRVLTDGARGYVLKVDE